MKKRWFILLGALTAVAVLAAVGYADVATFADPSIEAGKSGGGVTGFLTPIVELVLAGLGALMAMGARFLTLKMQGSKTRNILRFASAAVHYAESKFGPDTATGAKKEIEAVEFLRKNIKGLSEDDARKWVKAAYGAITTGLGPLGTPPAA